MEQEIYGINVQQICDIIMLTWVGIPLSTSFTNPCQEEFRLGANWDFTEYYERDVTTAEAYYSG